MFIVKIKKQFNCPGNTIESAEWFDTQEEAIEFAEHNKCCASSILVEEIKNGKIISSRYFDKQVIK